MNRWSIPYVAEILVTASRKGMSFNGRPDCANHTYLHYAYKLVYVLKVDARSLVLSDEPGR